MASTGDDIYVNIGGSKTISLNLDDSAGSNEDLSLLEGYIIVLYYPTDMSVLEKYSKNVISGYSNDIGTSDEANGNVDIYLKRSVSINGREEADVWVQVLYQDTDSNYASSQYRDWGEPKFAFTFKKPPITPTIDIS